ncbi:hypothetical protein [uncultured Polaribacter sp.]|uniref:hypothetical protein n=1 Tax=uncultured Polaribacter sp. TaxID=174711 RepID=UPI00259B6070|nr:hypothetical protein [uncultured Polaribacter sp.]
MKSKLLPILLIALIFLNGALIFMLINKPHEKRDIHPKRNFLTQELGFSEKQKNQFIEFDKIHRENMMEIDQELRQRKDILFSSFQKTNFSVDSLINQIGNLQAKKEAEVFRFFTIVRTLCNNEQSIKFDKIIKKAIRGGKPGLPNDRRMPPHEDGRHRPPR